MAYFAPFIDASGFHMPSYSDIRDQLISDARSIFGSDIYLGIDSQDYQWISSISNMIFDSFLTAQAAYNSRGPSTAIGTGLDINVKLNGIKRKPETYSTCTVLLSGTPGTTIANGIAGDINGIEWALSTSVTLDDTGKAIALATCRVPGPIEAIPGTINKIVTPTYGWTAITNDGATTIGENVESDAELRARQAISTALPSRTVLEGLKGAIAAISGVERSEVYENDTGVVDANGLPAHSITAVVEGGDDSNLAQTIFNKKGPGCYTNGTTSVTIPDQYGTLATVRFYRPTDVDIDVAINVKRLNGYTTDTTAAIKQAVASYISSLAIGDDLSISSLWGAALSANEVPSKPNFSITALTAARHGATKGTNDIAIAFNEVTRGGVANIVINLT